MYIKGKILGICTAACAAVFVGTAVAAWYADSSEYVFSGNVTVEGVIGNTGTVTIPEEQKGQSICYGAPKDASDTSYWLYSDSAGSENLTLEYTFNFSNVTKNSAFMISVSAEDENEGGKEYNSAYGVTTNGNLSSYKHAVDKEYIADVNEAEIEYISEGSKGVTFSKSDNIFTFKMDEDEHYAKVVITFKWGKAFTGEDGEVSNPYYIYRDYTTNEKKLEATDTLAYIAECLSGVQYKIVFTPVRL